MLKVMSFRTNVTSASDMVDVTDNGDGNSSTLTPEQGFFGNVDLTFDVSDGMTWWLQKTLT